MILIFVHLCMQQILYIFLILIYNSFMYVVIDVFIYSFI